MTEFSFKCTILFNFFFSCVSQPVCVQSLQSLCLSLAAACEVSLIVKAV